MKYQIETALKKGFSFICSKQLPSGEFPTMKWEKPRMQNASYVKSVFLTSFILHSLRHVEKFVSTEKVGRRAVDFLLSEMEEDGLWRFFGKNSRIHFDIDTTCCVLATLKEWGIKLDYKTIASGLLRYRNAEGVFNTWILDVDAPFEKKDNNVDWVVNANALFFYSILDQCLPEVEHYLIKVVEKETFKQRSPYYDSPFCFIYCLTRAYADGHNPRLFPAIPKIKDYLAGIMKKDEPISKPLENALVMVGLLNCGEDVAKLEQPIKHLLDIQRNDGGWPIDIFFTGGPYTEYRVAYGSAELTTAIALEAISKYAKRV